MEQAISNERFVVESGYECIENINKIKQNFVVHSF